MKICEYIKEYKELNFFGKMLGIKRRFFETNKKYKERLNYFTSAMKEPPKRTKESLMQALEKAGFYLNKYEITQDFNTGKITTIIEIY